MEAEPDQFVFVKVLFIIVQVSFSWMQAILGMEICEAFHSIEFLRNLCVERTDVNIKVRILFEHCA